MRRSRILPAWFLAVVMALTLTACGGGAARSTEKDSHEEPAPVTRKLIIDTDTAADDTSALILAAKCGGIEILGVTTMAGNVDLEQSTRNALQAMEIAHCDAPVYAGAEKTYGGKEINAFSVFGSDGMGDANLVHPTGTAQTQDAVSFMIETVRANPGEVEIVALGPATNIALAIERDPDAMRLVKRIWSMGTTGYGPGNASPVAEFNVCGDAEAYRVMLEFGAPVTVIGLDMCSGAAMWTAEQFEALRKTNAAGAFVADSFGKLREFYALNGSADAVMNCDSMAMMCALYPGFVKSSVQTHASCITEEGESYAQVIFYQEGFTYEMVSNAFDSYHVALVTEVAKDSYFSNYVDAIK